MPRMVDGTWDPDEEMVKTDESGSFERAETTFREWVRADPDATYPAAADRYHLYISRACPWAHRVVLVRKLKGLEETISMDVVDPVREDEGWEFAPEKPGCTPDTQHGSAYLRDVYAAADPTYTGRVTVPVLWDTTRETIVNNESADLMRMVDQAFDDHAERDVTLYPADHRDEIDRLVDELYESVNNGVYKAGFAETQEAYERAVDELFEALDRYDTLLGEQRYLVGDRLTLADICLFSTLYRFDPVYYVHFKCNEQLIAQYPNLSGYLRDLYQLPGVRETCNMDHVKAHYYRSHTDINPTQFVPTGPRQDLDAPHDREELPGEPPAALQ
ncbi:MAG: glutathione S-transferase family protein [Halodesulfurarchaeum sp.]